MADLTLNHTIPSAKVPEAVEYYSYLHKNTETIPDPAWVDPDDGSQAPQIAKYTDEQWVKEHIRRHIKGQIERGKAAKDRDNRVNYKADYVT